MRAQACRCLHGCSESQRLMGARWLEHQIDVTMFAQRVVTNVDINVHSLSAPCSGNGGGVQRRVVLDVGNMAL